MRAIYFGLAIISAAFGMLSTVFGFITIIQRLSADGETLHQAMQHGTLIDLSLTLGSMILWIIFSFLFVRADEKHEPEPPTGAPTP